MAEIPLPLSKLYSCRQRCASRLGVLRRRVDTFCIEECFQLLNCGVYKYIYIYAYVYESHHYCIDMIYVYNMHMCVYV